MHQFFNPGVFVRIGDKVLPFIATLTLGLLGLGLYGALVTSPPDYQQGEAVRMMYVHVPAAWMSLMVYMLVAGCGAAFLIWKNPLSSMMASAAAPVGAAFTFICLVTGSLWGKPMWGTWWVWDARLTSMLILFFFYLGYLALDNAYDDELRRGKMTAILSLVGVINIPIIKFSVEWWNTLHQPASILRSGGVAIDKTMLIPLLVMFLAFAGFFIICWFIRTKTLLNQRKIERLQAQYGRGAQ